MDAFLFIPCYLCAFLLQLHSIIDTSSCTNIIEAFDIGHTTAVEKLASLSLIPKTFSPLVEDIRKLKEKKSSCMEPVLVVCFLLLIYTEIFMATSLKSLCCYYPSLYNFHCNLFKKSQNKLIISYLDFGGKATSDSTLKQLTTRYLILCTSLLHFFASHIPLGLSHHNGRNPSLYVFS